MPWRGGLGVYNVLHFVDARLPCIFCRVRGKTISVVTVLARQVLRGMTGVPQYNRPRPSCPICGGYRRVGQIGSRQFFCWNCLVEYNLQRETFLITEEGTLVAFCPEGGENRVV